MRQRNTDTRPYQRGTGLSTAQECLRRLVARPFERLFARPYERLVTGPYERLVTGPYERLVTRPYDG